MRYMVLSDSHFGHDEMLIYEKRDQDFSNKILTQLRRFMKPDDIFVHLGDVCIGNETEWHRKLMRAIPESVRKWLIKGNHDKRSDSWYLSHGWDMVANALLLHKYGAVILLTHEPVDYLTGEWLQTRTLNTQHIPINIHGHVHESNRYNYSAKPYHHLITCVPPYTPTPLKTIVRQHIKEVYNATHSS